MTDQKTTTPSDVNETLTVSNLNKLDGTPCTNNAPFSLGKLEHDLRMLHVKWQAVEAEISERDKQIESLRQEIDAYQGQCSILESDLEEMAVEKNAISDDLASQSHRVSESADRVKKTEAHNIELSVHMQELQDYIDGRKTDWDKLSEQLGEYEDTIKGMSDSLASHENVVAGKEGEKAALALKVMELERELALLKGRHSEKESNNSELQQTLEDQSRELGSLNGDAMRLRKDVEKMQMKLGRRDETVGSLRRELKERSRDSSTLENLLSDEKSTIMELQLKLTVANQRIEELVADQQVRSEDHQISLSTSEATEQEWRDKAGELEIRSAESQAELMELRANFKGIEEELDAQRGLVQVLERELNDKQENLDVLDRSVDRLSALGSSIRELDMQIDDSWLKQPTESSEPAQEIFEQADEVMIPPEDLIDVGEQACEHLIVASDQESGEEVSYPLNGKNMTIGRSPHSDIYLNSKYISRIHAKIRVEGSTAIIEDAGSKNGFFVNSVRKRRHRLKDGDKLEIGDSKLRYVHN